jgi:hypothetical protein
MSRGIPALLGAAGISVALLLAGCTATPEPHPTTPSPTALTADDVAQRIHDTAFPTGSVAHTSGTLDAVDDVKVTIDVVALEALPDSTLLELRLATASGEQADTSTFQFAVAPFLDTRNIGLIDPADGKTYRPFTYQNARDVNGQNTGCLCDDVPASTDGAGVLISMIMPALPDGTSSVDIAIPGMKKMTGVPVIRG